MKHCVCAEKSIIIAQGLPESPHHVLGNLWIKIAGWFKRSGLSKHKQSGLTNVVDWLWFVLHLGQIRGLAVFSEHYLGVFCISFSLFFFISKLKCRANRHWCPFLCPSDIHVWFVRYLVHVVLFFCHPVRSLLWAIVGCAKIGLSSSKWLMEGGLWEAVSSKLTFLCQVKRLSHRSRHVLSNDRCQAKRKPFIGFLTWPYITEGVLHWYLINPGFLDEYSSLPHVCCCATEIQIVVIHCCCRGLGHWAQPQIVLL